MEEELYLVSLAKFCQLTMMGDTTARQIANSKEMCDRGISVRANPLKPRGSIRINWPRYLAYLSECE